MFACIAAKADVAEGRSIDGNSCPEIHMTIA
jgi:hypothetical protein